MICTRLVATTPVFAECDQLAYAGFARESDTLEQALLSAIANVEQVANVRAIAVADESWLTAEEIAERAGRSLDRIMALTCGDDGPGDFPPPLAWAEGSEAQWEWLKVRDWFADRLGEQLNDPNAAVFTALTDTLRARASCAKLERPQQQRITALLSG